MLTLVLALVADEAAGGSANSLIVQGGMAGAVLTAIILFLRHLSQQDEANRKERKEFADQLAAEMDAERSARQKQVDLCHEHQERMVERYETTTANLVGVVEKNTAAMARMEKA